jgi:hypothetical protein
MELWKVHKFCEGASLAELQARREKIIALIEKNALSNTNAEKVLSLLDEYIELKRLFEQD